MQKLVDLDGKRGRFEALVWSESSNSIRVLLDNQYVSQDCWLFKTGSIAEDEWRQRFASTKHAAHVAFGLRDTVTVLRIVLSRIYTLRNQLVHGGATWNNSVNRGQTRDCANLMGRLVPLVIETMMDHPGALWRDACCPVVE